MNKFLKVMLVTFICSTGILADGAMEILSELNSIIISDNESDSRKVQAGWESFNFMISTQLTNEGSKILKNGRHDNNTYGLRDGTLGEQGTVIEYIRNCAAAITADKSAQATDDLIKKLVDIYVSSTTVGFLSKVYDKANDDHLFHSACALAWMVNSLGLKDSFDIIAKEITENENYKTHSTELFDVVGYIRADEELKDIIENGNAVFESYAALDAKDLVDGKGVLNIDLDTVKSKKYLYVRDDEQAKKVIAISGLNAKTAKSNVLIQEIDLTALVNLERVEDNFMNGVRNTVGKSPIVVDLSGQDKLIHIGNNVFDDSAVSNINVVWPNPNNIEEIGANFMGDPDKAGFSFSGFNKLKMVDGKKFPRINLSYEDEAEFKSKLQPITAYLFAKDEEDAKNKIATNQLEKIIAFLEGSYNSIVKGDVSVEELLKYSESGHSNIDQIQYIALFYFKKQLESSLKNAEKQGNSTVKILAAINDTIAKNKKLIEKFGNSNANGRIADTIIELAKKEYGIPNK